MPNPKLTAAQFEAITAAVALLEVHLEDDGTRQQIATLDRAYRKVQDWFEGEGHGNVSRCGQGHR